MPYIPKKDDLELLHKEIKTIAKDRREYLKLHATAWDGKSQEKLNKHLDQIRTREALCTVTVEDKQILRIQNHAVKPKILTPAQILTIQSFFLPGDTQSQKDTKEREGTLKALTEMAEEEEHLTDLEKDAARHNIPDFDEKRKNEALTQAYEDKKRSLHYFFTDAEKTEIEIEVSLLTEVQSSLHLYLSQ